MRTRLLSYYRETVCFVNIPEDHDTPDVIDFHGVLYIWSNSDQAYIIAQNVVKISKDNAHALEITFEDPE